MYPASRIRRTWAINGALILLAGATSPAFGQKFARARADAADTDSDSTATESESAPAPIRSRVNRRTTSIPRRSGLSYTYAPRPLPRPTSQAALPGWQTTNGSSAPGTPGRVIRHRPGDPPVDPHEGDVIYEEPTFGPQFTSPGLKTKSTVVKQSGRLRNAAEVIGPGQPTPASGARGIVNPEGAEAPVVDSVEGEVFEDGTVVEGDDGEVIYEGDGSFLNGGCSDCDGCNYQQWGPYYPADDGPGRIVPCDGICIPRRLVDETAIFIGAQGFTSPLDLGTNGNFGYHEGVNFAGHFGRWLGLGSMGIGYQVGATFLQSDLNGNLVNGVQTKERDQQFLTAGLFRRAHDGYGLQGGAVFDYMHDNFYAKYNVSQIRGEFSYLTLPGHEFGFWGAFSVHDASVLVNGATVGYQTINMYNGFYRYTFRNGAQGRMWGGGTDFKQGVLGADFRLPLSNKWDLWGWYNYLIPNSNGFVGATQQGWNLTLNLVWYPGRRPCGTHNTPFRALFAPADNNWMISRPSAM